MPGIIDKPIAMRGVHGSNTLLTRRPEPQNFVWSELEIWLKNNLDNEEKLKYWVTKEKDLALFIFHNKGKSVYTVLKNLQSILRKHPVIFFNHTDFKRLITKTIGKGFIVKLLLRIKDAIVKIFFYKTLTIQLNAHFYHEDEKRFFEKVDLIKS